ncbi:hypothetical protein ACHAWF_005113 [Thalassiosira exigua]
MTTLRTAAAASLPAARTLGRRAALGTAGAGAVGGASLAAYAVTDRGRGFRREVAFWSSVFPVVADYWWNASESSPKSRLRGWLDRSPPSSDEGEGEDDLDDERASEEEEEEERKRTLTLAALHERNAPRIFDAMLDLGGLYVKLGQVLSVTALPVPEEYRIRFRTLQSDVPGSRDFDDVVKPALERELGAPLEELFARVDRTPCGAASIGQAHGGTLGGGGGEEGGEGEEVVLKVQYPEAGWQVPADVECVGDFLRLCAWFGVVDESAARLSYDEFSRQFLAELDYEREAENLRRVHASTLDPRAPYAKWGVVVPRVFDDMCTEKVITMTYLPGPKFEEEARRQLALLGIDSRGGMRSVVRKAHRDATQPGEADELASSPARSSSWGSATTRILGTLVSVDSMFSVARFARRAALWSTAAAVRGVWAASALSLAPASWTAWADERQHSILQAERWNWTQEAVTALLDVHGYQVLNQGLFNADPHPGNILVVQDDEHPSHRPKIGLIDYGQVKQLEPEERVKIARLILSIADKEADEVIAGHFRDLGIKTKTDSTRFLAEFGRLMFGSFEAKHLDHEWHKNLHREDRVLYFPNELSMVYRTALLLRGLAMSLQFNPSVGEEWRHHAEETLRLQVAVQEEE